MLRWLGGLVAAASLSWFALLLVTGNYYNEGPVVFTLTAGHGIHRGDIGVTAFWAAGMIGLGLLSWPSRGRAAPHVDAAQRREETVRRQRAPLRTGSGTANLR